MAHGRLLCLVTFCIFRCQTSTGFTVHDDDKPWVGHQATNQPTPDLVSFLEQEGLGCCVDQITQTGGGWMRKGSSGVDQTRDIRFLTDEIIDRMHIPPVKANILKSLAQRFRYAAHLEAERKQRDYDDQKRRESWTRNWFDNALAAAETLMRGFMLGFGLSFIYETLFLNSDFYTEVHDLTPRVQRASFRAVVLGTAVACTMHGSSIFVPYSWRDKWIMGA